jgi:vancomycin resistance protein YoaR
MAVVVIVEDGTRVSGANSYVSIADITAWVLTNPHDITWAALTEAQQNGYTVMACRILNEQMDWDGWQTDSDQSLDLPRSGMVDKNGNSIEDYEVPFEVENAQCELARLLAITDRTGDSDLVGFSEMTIGPIKLTADKSDNLPVLPDAVFNMVRYLGRKTVSKGLGRTVRM